MAEPFKLACVQNCAVADVSRNIEIAGRLTRAAIDQGAQLTCLPEYFSGVELRDGLLHPAAFEESRHPVLQAFIDLARERRAWLLLGSLGVRARMGASSTAPTCSILAGRRGALRQAPPVRCRSCRREALSRIRAHRAGRPGRHRATAVAARSA